MAERATTAREPVRAILLIDNGSRRADANASLEEVAALLRGRVPAGVIVEHAHMELAEPTIAQAFARCVSAGATHVIAHPYMLAAGRHATEDIPRLVADAARAHPGVSHNTTAPLGLHPLLADIILARCLP